jgi:hypothetical protein
MTEFDPERFEAELRKLEPAVPPEELRCRLDELKPNRLDWENSRSSSGEGTGGFLARFWWSIATAAALGIAVAVLYPHHSTPLQKTSHPLLTRVAQSQAKADQIEIDQQLLSVFDAIARLPSGEPVRFHCREWMYGIVLRDSARGFVLERQMPRLEVVPVRFETY